MTTNTIIEALKDAAADLADEVQDIEDRETTPDIDAEIIAAEAELASAEQAETEAAGVADPEEFHKLADAVRWCRARVERLRAARVVQLAAAAEQRRQEATAEAERLLVEVHPLSDVVSAYCSAEQALHGLVQACEARQGAIEDVARLLRRAGVSVPSGGPAPSVTLPSGLHASGDLNAGQLIAEMVLDVAEKRHLATDGHTALVSLLSRSISRVSRGRVARLAKRETEVRADAG
ncbi:MAG: hypothetical protein M0R75_15165 [Dehalococcoidia bacterium]|nr:hypothetical protein [Dehalococcoidia bacterium]